MMTTRPTHSAAISYPYTFVPGQILPAAQLNANFTAVKTVVDSSIQNSNISASAAIALSKLALTSTALNLMATGNPTWASGITGDTQPRITLYSNGVLGFGPGNASAIDIILKRSSSSVLAIRNAADNADGGLTASTGVFSDDISAVDVSASGSLRLTNGSTLVITPAAIAADRAITFIDPGAAGALRCTTGSMNANGALYTDGTNVLSTATGGSGTRVLTSVAGAAPTWEPKSNVFGGDGSDGAVSLTSGTDTAPRQTNATTVALNDGVVRVVLTGTVINASSTITIGQGASGQLAVQSIGGAAPPCAGTTGYPGNGLGGGFGSITASGASGGSNGAAGGSGGAAGTAIFSRAAPVMAPCGSGGGSCPLDFGGAGGGRITFCAIGAITIAANATVSANGASASTASLAGTTGGAGGGSGGTMIFASQTSITNSGTISATGGAGGGSATTSGYGGGGGGGGRVVLWSPSNTAGTITLTGGAAGVGVTGNGQAGSTATAYTITGTPNLPLIGWLQESNNIEKLCKHELQNRDVALIAADGDLVKYLTYMSGSLTETCEAIGETEVLASCA